MKRTITGIALSAILLPIAAACTSQPTAQAPTTTQPAPEATTPVSPAPNAQTPANAQSVADLIENNPSLSTLSNVIDEADLGDTLEQGGPYTIFAPSDQAFAAIPAATRERLLRDENRALLRQILTNHVVPGSLTASQLQSGQIQTQAGSPVNLQIDGQQVRINDAQVIQPDLLGANGVVHIVDRIILPPNVNL
ncbi:fasciclin domain-containing protein [Leptolyngbya sp. AN03gr2]|uniref:fasciclin domain-containing protein n=1 Tax=unclassified Leptolyngbya TaxID=2650499 RepID=UPI003D312A12